MKLKSSTLALALAFAVSAYAQSGASAPAASSPAKKELVQKVLKLQQQSLDGLAAQMTEQPAMQLAQQAQMALQARVAADKREAVGRELQADLKKYMDETLPIVRERTNKVAPGVMGAMLEERFTEDELKQVVAWLESPVARKYQQMAPDLQRSLMQKLGPEVGPLIEPKARALQQAMGQHLGLQQPAAAAPASAPKKK